MRMGMGESRVLRVSREGRGWLVVTHLLEFWGYKVGWVRIAGALYWCPSESCLGFIL